MKDEPSVARPADKYNPLKTANYERGGAGGRRQMGAGLRNGKSRNEWVGFTIWHDMAGFFISADEWDGGF
jgi:hypothetical protein